MSRITWGSQPRLGGGCSLTFLGDLTDQAVYWYLVSYNPETGLEGPPLGILLFLKSKTDGAKLAKNYYYAPRELGTFFPRFGTRYFGTFCFGENQVSGYDRVKVKWAHA